MEIIIREALPHEAATLTDIAHRAKQHWGYADAQIALWQEFLTVAPDYIAANQVWVATIQGQAAGFATIVQHTDEAELDHLWVLPDYMGKGVGKRLFQHVTTAVPTFVFTSDPHADAFYYKMGAQKIGEAESTLQGRTLTKFRYAATPG